MTEYTFDTPLECVQRAIRGFEHKALRGVALSEADVLNALQAQFSTMTRDELKDIYKNYDNFYDFEING